MTLPDGTGLKLSGLRTFAVGHLRATSSSPTARLVSTIDGSVLTPDHSRGFYVNEAGETVPPGWRVNIGSANFQRIFTSEGIRQPMLAIFVWTMAFAMLSVSSPSRSACCSRRSCSGRTCRFKPLYRLLLILPYSVPAFISILVFKGLFNQNFGEINLILEALFGITPELEHRSVPRPHRCSSSSTSGSATPT